LDPKPVSIVIFASGNVVPFYVITFFAPADKVSEDKKLRR